MLKKMIVFVSLIGFHALAANYGMAGCGLGALVFQDQPGKIQIVAATLNNIVSPQTSAITTGTSNCYEGSRDEVSLRFIENNKTALKDDVARGQGETLDGLMTIWACKEKNSVQMNLKQNYNNIFESNETLSILQNLKSNSEVQKTCQSDSQS
ncbi:MAG: DUF3015 family protein [Deltaproteobacteria bacterium]|nr:DUF3015 family protein [Deltaproteobacteria bacterium]